MRIAAACLALALGACAHRPAMDVADSLAAAETAFAAHSMRADMRVAFLAHFADDGVFVRSGWTRSNDYLRDRPAPPIVLDWRPQYVEVAASGELGLSTGPSKITSRTDPAAAPAYGQFVSVWRRAPGGPWKVEVDLGISHAGPALWDQPLQARTVPHSPATSMGLAAAEARFAADAAQRGARAAYRDHGAQDLRYYRSGHAPVASLATALAHGAMDDERVAWTAERSETAQSGDFGYVRGRYAAASAPGTTLGWYLRVWRREASGWRIALDVVNPAPRS